MGAIIEVKTTEIVLLREAPGPVVHVDLGVQHQEAIDLTGGPGIVDVVVAITVSAWERPVQREEVISYNRNVSA
jgi:hypothetical protein